MFGMRARWLVLFPVMCVAGSSEEEAESTPPYSRSGGVGQLPHQGHSWHTRGFVSPLLACKSKTDEASCYALKSPLGMVRCRWIDDACKVYGFQRGGGARCLLKNETTCKDKTSNGVESECILMEKADGSEKLCLWGHDKDACSLSFTDEGSCTQGVAQHRCQWVSLKQEEGSVKDLCVAKRPVVAEMCSSRVGKTACTEGRAKYFCQYVEPTEGQSDGRCTKRTSGHLTHLPYAPGADICSKRIGEDKAKCQVAKACYWDEGQSKCAMKRHGLAGLAGLHGHTGPHGHTLPTTVEENAPTDIGSPDPRHEGPRRLTSEIVV